MIVHRCNLIMDFIKGICLLFTDFDHNHFRSKLQGIISIMSKILGTKSVYVCVKKRQYRAFAANKFCGEIMCKS